MADKIKLTFLGTAASIPTPKRNHTSILLDYKGEHILFDCGEGTQRQFRKARLNPGKITRILISHWHGDHVLGIPGLLQTLSLSGYRKTLYICGPKGTKSFMREILKICHFAGGYKIKVEEVSGIFFKTDDFCLEAKPMTHRIPCNAYNFIRKGKRRINKKKLTKTKIPLGPLISKLKQGKNINYKGKKYLGKNLTFLEGKTKISIIMDTSDNKKIIPFVKNSDVLICEASFGEDLKAKAKEHLHLTAKQTGEIAKKANAKRLILIHISQRYEKNLKTILNQAKKEFKNTSIVKDLDEIELK